MIKTVSHLYLLTILIARISFSTCQIAVNGTYYQLTGSNFGLSSGKFTYTIYLFKNIMQYDNTINRNFNLGYFDSYSDNKFYFSNGDYCIDRKVMRSGILTVICGSSYRISLSESPLCYYSFTITTLAACLTPAISLSTIPSALSLLSGQTFLVSDRTYPFVISMFSSVISPYKATNEPIMFGDICNGIITSYVLAENKFNFINGAYDARCKTPGNVRRGAIKILCGPSYNGTYTENPICFYNVVIITSKACVPPTYQPSSQPTRQPSSQPSQHPSFQLTTKPSLQPLINPTEQPTSQPSLQPMGHPSNQPTYKPFLKPNGQPSPQPSGQPSQQPYFKPKSKPSYQPIFRPSTRPIRQPSIQPTERPSRQPYCRPSSQPSQQPSMQPSNQPSSQPTCQPTIQPSVQPSIQPSIQPSSQPSYQPSGQPSNQPSYQPLSNPSSRSSTQPSIQPSFRPSKQFSQQPTTQPSEQTSSYPPCQLSSKPIEKPSQKPSLQTSIEPKHSPSCHPTTIPFIPTLAPSGILSNEASRVPTATPTSIPTLAPSAVILSNEQSIVPSISYAVGLSIGIALILVALMALFCYYFLKRTKNSRIANTIATLVEDENIICNTNIAIPYPSQIVLNININGQNYQYDRPLNTDQCDHNLNIYINESAIEVDENPDEQNLKKIF